MQVNPQECIFLSPQEIQNLRGYSTFLNEDTIPNFIETLDLDSNLKDISTLMISQDYFYQNQDSWCDFQDSLAKLFCILPSLQFLKNLYLKLDLYSSSSQVSFRSIDKSITSFSIKKNGDSMEYNALSFLGQVLNGIKQQVKVHIIISISMDYCMNQFLDALSFIKGLESLKIKYFIQEQGGPSSRETQKTLFTHMTHSIAKCQSLEIVQIKIPSFHRLSPIPNRDSYQFEVSQLSLCLSNLKNLKQVSLHLPAEFFLHDYLKEKEAQEQTISESLRKLKGIKQIYTFELILIRSKNTPNLRRRTAQLKDLQLYLRQHITTSLFSLIKYSE